MSVIKHILIATDGSEGSLKAAALAGDLARALRARTTLLMVQSDDLIIASAWGTRGFPEGTPQGAMSVEEIRSLLEQRVRDRELPDTASALGELEHEPTLVAGWGHPTEEICRYAKAHAVDLIVIGSHGRTGIKRAILGSVSHAVVNQAPCPVTVVR